MGSKLALAYANTFMEKLKQSILESYPLKPSYYRRFIDNILMMWPHSETETNKTVSLKLFVHNSPRQLQNLTSSLLKVPTTKLQHQNQHIEEILNYSPEIY